ncbi:hypothetical protein OTU49_008314, partial [Cherax quadricarinatus]
NPDSLPDNTDGTGAIDDHVSPTPQRRGNTSKSNMDRTLKNQQPTSRLNHSLRLHPYRGTYPFESEVRGEGYHSRIRFDPFGSGVPLKDQHAPRSQTFGNWSPRPVPSAQGEAFSQFPPADRPPQPPSFPPSPARHPTPPSFPPAPLQHPQRRRPASMTASSFAHQLPGYQHPPIRKQPHTFPA